MIDSKYIKLVDEKAENKEYLKFSNSNKKLDKIPNWLDVKKSDIKIFNLTPVETCPYAYDCQKVYKCYAISLEEYRPDFKANNKYNFDLLRKHHKSIDKMADLIDSSLKQHNCKIVRIHSSGDFFNERYLKAWLKVARNNKDIIFYAYTTSIPFWINNLDEINSLENFKLIASLGTNNQDHLIKKYNLQFSKVVYSENEADRLGLKADYDEKMAISQNDNFALVIHGTQPKNHESYKIKRLNLVRDNLSIV
tara:strand:- start:304 stop:1056 length:753 start_codon:yes stop_codon:yes gene_type:complete